LILNLPVPHHLHLKVANGGPENATKVNQNKSRRYLKQQESFSRLLEEPEQ
jgi:hypothetical protein